MIIGIPKEIKAQEFRAAVSPALAGDLVNRGHQILIQKDLGKSIGMLDEDYVKQGANIAQTAEEVYQRAELIIKVKEPQPEEYKLLKKGQTIFCYLHLAPDVQQTAGLLASGCTAIAYETVKNEQGQLPLLVPMSEVAGRVSIQVGAHHMEQTSNGSGILLGGVPGVSPAKVMVLGGGTVGINAAQMALGLGADVSIFDTSLARLRDLDWMFNHRLKTLYASPSVVKEHALQADLIIGAVLIPGATSPKLILQDWLSEMKDKSLMVDVSIDQGGCFETSKPTSHEKPTYAVNGVMHYCVPNIPSAVARTSSLALINATHNYVLQIADLGIKKALKTNATLRAGLNVHAGQITHQAVAESQNKAYTPPEQALA